VAADRIVSSGRRRGVAFFQIQHELDSATGSDPQWISFANAQAVVEPPIVPSFTGGIQVRGGRSKPLAGGSCFNRKQATRPF